MAFRQAENRVKIEGILAETDLKYGSFVKNGETIEVTKAQCDQLTELGYVETKEEALKRQEFVDNLKSQHPDKLSYSQLTGDNSGMLTPRDINYISTFKLTKI